MNVATLSSKSNFQGLFKPIIRGPRPTYAAPTRMVLDPETKKQYEQRNQSLILLRKTLADTLLKVKEAPNADKKALWD